jgi:penicillin V acylase-like amidase (Ntn superfamily)
LKEMNTNQERKTIRLIKQDLKLTYALFPIIVTLMSFALLTMLVGLILRGLPVKAGHTSIESACTSFCLNKDGHAVFGSNYDNKIWEGLLFVNKRGVAKSGFEASTTGKYAYWTAKYGSLTFNLAGFQMAWAGMNEAGLVISTMWLGETRNPPSDERPPLPSPLWVQYQLDTCATIDEMMANDSRVRITGTVDHYLICDRLGACAVVEFLEGKTVFYTDNTMPVKTLTNHAYMKAIGAWQAGRLVDNSLKRFGIAANHVMNFKPVDTPSTVAYAFEILKQASGQATGSTPTQWSIIFDTENLRVHFHTKFNSKVRSVDFAKVDFACDTPVRMMDVHAPLTGDISNKLDRYTFEANLQHTLNFFEKYRGTRRSFRVEVLERFFTSFNCEQPAAPYQKEKKLIVTPLVGWIVLTLFHRLWPVGVVVGLGVIALVIWRVYKKKGNHQGSRARE